MHLQHNPAKADHGCKPIEEGCQARRCTREDDSHGKSVGGMAGGEGIDAILEAERGMKGASLDEERSCPANRMLQEQRKEAAEDEGV
jgi:hypothetical protein